MTSRCDVISDVINIKSTFSAIICNDLSISDVKISLSEIIWNFSKWPPFRGPGELLNRKLYRKLSATSNRPCPYLHFELLIDVQAKKLTELRQWPIFWPRDLVPWPTYLSMLLTGTADPIHMWTKFGDDMSKLSWVMLDKTDRQTDRWKSAQRAQTCQNSIKVSWKTLKHW